MAGLFIYTHSTMRKETLKALGINVSEDVNAGDLLCMNKDELMEPETAYKIIALRELCEEFCDMRASKVKLVTTSGDAAKVLSPNLKCLDHEECWILLLSRSNGIIAKKRMTTGSSTACIFDVAGIVRQAVLSQAAGIIIAHNHPSGNVLPSEADIKETEKMKKALKYLSISLVDHIIISDDRYYSFADEHSSDL